MKDMFGNSIQEGDKVFIFDRVFIVVGKHTNESDIIVQRYDYSGGYGEKLVRYAFNAVKLSPEQVEAFTDKELYNAMVKA